MTRTKNARCGSSWRAAAGAPRPGRGITALVTSPGSDLIQIQRLKKRKLILRDKIRLIEDQLTPDIIA